MAAKTKGDVIAVLLVDKDDADLRARKQLWFAVEELVRRYLNPSFLPPFPGPATPAVQMACILPVRSAPWCDRKVATGYIIFVLSFSSFSSFSHVLCCARLSMVF